jgi:hypothetical protein
MKDFKFKNNTVDVKLLNSIYHENWEYRHTKILAIKKNCGCYPLKSKKIEYDNLYSSFEAIQILKAALFLWPIWNVPVCSYCSDKQEWGSVSSIYK